MEPTSATTPEPASGPTFSSGEGGPWNALMGWLRLATHLRRQLAVIVAFASGPILVADLVWQRSSAPELYVRMLVALPLLLLSDRLIGWATGECSSRLLSAGLIPADELDRYKKTVSQARRLWRSWQPELVAVVVAFAVSPVIEEAGGTPLGTIWNNWVALVLFRFLLLRTLWRWGVWGVFCVGLARVRLALAANHPDRAGGSSFLRLPSVALAPALAGLSALVCIGLDQPANILETAGVGASVLVVALTPPTILGWRLSQFRYVANRTFGRAALSHGRAFLRRMTRADIENDEEFEASQQTDFGSEVERVARMGLVPYGRETLIAVAGPSLLPFLAQYVIAKGLDTALLTVGRRLLG